MGTESSETILIKCGGCGIFQISAAILVLFSRLTSALLVLLPVYISHKQPMFCNNTIPLPTDVWSKNFIGNFTSDNHNRNIEINQLFCSFDTIKEVCSSITMKNKPFTSTIREQYDLFCVGRNLLPAAASSCCMGGILLGSFVVGSLSDCYGRLIVLSISGFISGIFSFLALFSPYFWMHALARFFVGIGVAGLFSAGNSYIIEVIPLKQRLPVSIIALGGWNVGNLVLCLIAYFIRNHFHIQLIVSIFTFNSVLYYFIMPESFRWLISMGKKERAIKSILTMAKFNRKEIDKMEISNEIDIIFQNNRASQFHKKTEQLKDVLKFKNIRVYLAIFWTVFFTVSLVYYMLSLSSGKFSEDVFLGAFSVAATTLITRIFIILVGLYFGRVTILSTLSFSVCILLIATSILTWTVKTSNLIPIFLVSSTFFSEASFSWLWIYSAEVFPTIIRTACVSTSSGFARFGGLLAPQLLSLNEIFPGIAYAICGFLMFFNFLLPLVKLPETNGFISVDYLKDAEDQLPVKERLWMKCGQNNEVEDVNITMETET